MHRTEEWSNFWIQEINELSRVIRIALAIQLAAIPGEDEKLDRINKPLPTF
jgi:hypothetical protein